MAIYSAEIFPRYAETDQMGVIYHANYFVWFEVARGMLYEHLGFHAEDLSKGDVLYPVRRVHCEYRRPARYGRVVLVEIKILKFSGVRIIYSYKVNEKESGELLATGTTEHGITDANLRPLNLKNYDPETSRVYVEYMQECARADS